MENRFINEQIGLKILTIIYVLTVFLGNTAIINIKIFKIMPTYYRVLIPIMFLFLIIYLFKNNKNKIIILKENKYTKLYLYTMIFWIIYGTALLFLGRYSVLDIGAREILSLILGTISVCICVLLYINNQLDTIILTVKCIMILMIIIGIIEIICGKHLDVSMYNDSAYISAVKALSEDGQLPKSFGYYATGTFYNPNDYCAFLSIFAPVFLYKHKKIFGNILNYFCIFITFIIMLVNDSWISMIALVLGILLYLILSKAAFVEYIMQVICLLLARYFGQNMITGIKKMLFGDNVINSEASVNKIEQALETQLQNAANNQGSLFYRINTYVESIKEMFLQSKGCGLGAGSYSNYFSTIAEKKLMMQNPHSLWIEILSQYGLIVFLLFIVVLVLIMIKLIVNYKKTGDLRVVLVIVTGVIFSFSCFAPSSFLQNSYYWMPIGMGLAIIICDDYGRE